GVLLADGPERVRRRHAVGLVRPAPAVATDSAVPPHGDVHLPRNRRARGGVPGQGSAPPAAGRRGGARDAVALPVARPVGQRSRSELVGAAPCGTDRSTGRIRGFHTGTGRSLTGGARRAPSAGPAHPA